MPKFWAHLSLKYIPKWPKGGEWEQRRHCVCPKKFLQSFHFSTNWTVWSICHPLPFEGPCLIVGSVINGHFIRMLTIIWLLVTLRGLAYFHILIDLIGNSPWWYITSVYFSVIFIQTSTPSKSECDIREILIRMNVRIYLYQQNYTNEYPNIFILIFWHERMSE